MRAYMFLQVIICFEPFITHLALKRSFICVNTLVALQPKVTRENLPTERTRVRSLVIAVNPQMFSEFLLIFKLFITRGACVFLHTCMGACVPP